MRRGDSEWATAARGLSRRSCKAARARRTVTRQIRAAAARRCVVCVHHHRIAWGVARGGLAGRATWRERAVAGRVGGRASTQPARLLARADVAAREGGTRGGWTMPRSCGDEPTAVHAGMPGGGGCASQGGGESSAASGGGRSSRCTATGTGTGSERVRASREATRPSRSTRAIGGSSAAPLATRRGRTPRGEAIEADHQIGRSKLLTTRS